MGANAEEFANWIVKNPQLKGTPQFDTVAKALEETLASEKMAAGGSEFGNESVLYDRPQAGIGRKLLQSGIKGVAGLADIPAGFMENSKRLAQYSMSDDMPVPPIAQPVTQFLQKQGIITPEAEFNTPIGRVADFTTQLGTGGGLNANSVLRSATTKPLIKALPSIAGEIGKTTAQGLIGGSVNELANEIGVENPMAKALAVGTAMGGTNAGASLLKSSPQKLISDSLEGVTPEQLRMAQMLVDKSVQIGSPITGAEAIAQVTGNKALTGTQRFLENSKDSQAQMSQFMGKRPEQLEKAFNVVVEGISPEKVNSMTPSRMQKAGAKVISDADANITKNLDPVYKQAASDMSNVKAGKGLPVMEAEVNALLQNPAVADAVSHVLNNSYSKVKGLSPNDPKTLIAAKQYLDAQYNKFGSKKNESYDKNKAGSAFGASRELDTFLKGKSPVYEKGSNSYENAQKQQMTPIREGAIGEIAGMDGNAEKMMRAQSDALMPKAPRATTPQDIERTVNLLRRKDPTLASDWTRQNLEGIFNETSKTLTGGENQFAGAKLASVLQGNKAQKENLQSLITSSSGMQAYQGFERFMDVMEAQGQRMPANSATSFNESMKQELGGGIASKVATLSRPSNIARGVEEFTLRRNSKMLASMLTDPKSVDKLEELARTKPNSAKAQAIVSTLMGSYIAAKPEIKEEEK